MIYWLNILLFLVTVIAGSAPLWFRNWQEKQLKYLLAFSGAYLLSVTMLHLIPEIVSQIGFKAGLWMLLGFFIQQALQKFTHGVEHGHAHKHNHGSFDFLPLFLGMSLHAFTEGIPLGVHYEESTTVPSLYLAIALHKLPEAMLITSLVLHEKRNKTLAFVILVVFALLTPVSSILTDALGHEMASVARFTPYVIAAVMGSFLHIGTTIFFESGTKSHEMSWRKWLIIIAGIGLAYLMFMNADHTGHVH